MNRTLRRAAGTVACALALGVAAAPVAHAESQSHRDPKGDVSTVTPPTRAAAPAVDVLSSTNTYQRSTLTMSVKAAKLAKSGYVAEWFVTTADNTYVLIYDTSQGGEPIVQFIPIGGPLRVGPLRAPAGIPPCTDVAVKPSVKKSRITATVARSCLAGADTVRVAAVLLKQVGSDYKVDDARRKGFELSNQPKFGPALDRN